MAEQGIPKKKKKPLIVGGSAPAGGGGLVIGGVSSAGGSESAATPGPAALKPPSSARRAPVQIGGSPPAVEPIALPAKFKGPAGPPAVIGAPAPAETGAEASPALAEEKVEPITLPARFRGPAVATPTAVGAAPEGDAADTKSGEVVIGGPAAGGAVLRKRPAVIGGKVSAGTTGGALIGGPAGKAVAAAPKMGGGAGPKSSAAADALRKAMAQSAAAGGAPASPGSPVIGGKPAIGAPPVIGGTPAVSAETEPIEPEYEEVKLPPEPKPPFKWTLAVVNRCLGIAVGVAIALAAFDLWATVTAPQRQKQVANGGADRTGAGVEGADLSLDGLLGPWRQAWETRHAWIFANNAQTESQTPGPKPKAVSDAQKYAMECFDFAGVTGGDAIVVDKKTGRLYLWTVKDEKLVASHSFTLERIDGRELGFRSGDDVFVVVKKK